MGIYNQMKAKLNKIKDKKVKVIKNDHNHKKKKKNKIKQEDSDLSDLEGEIIEEVPQDVSLKVQKLIKETNDEIFQGKVEGTDFLDKDPLIDFDLGEEEGFLPESESLVNTGEIWSKLRRLSIPEETKESSLERLKPMYTEIGRYLANYKSGPLPKGFKVIPKMSNWTEVLKMTNPQNWTPNAMHQATILFSSNMKEPNAQIFYEYVLLPAVREDLSRNRKLNPHYYESLIKAVFKPKAWFKGILVPLVKEGCSYREISVIGSVVRRVSIPALHVSVFVLEICQYHKWFGSTSFILTILFQKRYKLPLNVIRECLNYFYKFVNFNDNLPVIWHQSLYVFLMNYKHLLNEEEMEKLKELLRKHKHLQIGKEMDKMFSCQIEEITI